MFQNIYCALANIKIVIPLSIMSSPSGCMMECCTPHPGSILISGMTKLRVSYRIRFTLGSIFRMRENAWWVSPGNALCEKKVMLLNCLLTCNLSFTYKDENGLNLSQVKSHLNGLFGAYLLQKKKCLTKVMSSFGMLVMDFVSSPIFPFPIFKWSLE